MNPKKIDKQDVVERAKARFELAAESNVEIRKVALEDYRFRSGDQWPADVKHARDIDKRPCLTINQLPQFLRQITNDQRQNRPSIQVNPVDDQGDIETAKVLEGIIRHIEYASGAEIAYDTASDGQCTGGFGYFRIVTEYCSPLSFDQEIRIKRIRDPFSVYLDPSSQEPDGSDMNWGFIIDELSKDDFKNQYPDAELSSMADWSSLGNTASNWVNKDGCRIAEYFEKEFKDATICLMSDGSIVDKQELPKELPSHVEIVSERKTKLPYIKWFKINGLELLEETEWPGQWIPIIPVLGDEIFIDGKRILEGVIRHAKDSQRMYNYWASAETETIALAPKAPFIGYEGQFEGHEKKWQTANTANHAYLEVKPKSIGGVPAPLPTRNVYEPPVQAITNARVQSANDLRATTGIYDSTLGNRSNEQSGLAIQRRNQQAQTSNYHFTDNFTRSLKHAGRILVDLIPHIYDTARTIRIIGESGDQEVVAINKLFEKDGKQTYFDLNRGVYDVTVSTGPNYQTKRQEAVASMLSLIQAYPNLVPLTGDLLVKNMDWPGAQEISERLKKTLPPALQEGSEKEQVPPQVQAQMQQMQSTIQQLSGQFHAADDLLKNKMLELASKERIAMAQIKANIEINLAKLGHQSAETMLDHEIEGINRRLDMIGENEPMNLNLGAGGNSPAGTQNPQPTGGISPGSPMGV